MGIPLYIQNFPLNSSRPLMYTYLPCYINCKFFIEKIADFYFFNSHIKPLNLFCIANQIKFAQLNGLQIKSNLNCACHNTNA